MKKKFFIGITSICMILITMFTLVGCGAPKEKTFSYVSETNDMYSITLNDSFREQNMHGFSMILSNNDVVFMLSKENFIDYENLGYDTENMSRSDYAELCISANNLAYSTVEYDEENDIYYFEYVKTLDKEYYYYATVQKGNNCFWLSQFACFSSQKTKLLQNFTNWAKTISAY